MAGVQPLATTQNEIGQVPDPMVSPILNVDNTKCSFTQGLYTENLGAKRGESNEGCGIVYHRQQDSGFLSISSIETQPPIHYGQTAQLYQSIDYSYDPDQVNTTYNPFFGGFCSFENSGQYALSSIESVNYRNSQTSFDSQTSIQSQTAPKKNQVGEYDAFNSVNVGESKEAPTVSSTAGVLHAQTTEAVAQPKNKVVAVNPVILVDKVERSLVVQWYENSVRREQRISYKKYGNAKAQQRAEGLINKLLAGSTFDQLYPEKGPPILTIFENAGEYMVTLTRDRIMREWRVDWVNSNGSKMRARWSCKKVGNEEARKRAETFANSLLQGTFNPRLLHKATGTRLSRNDMKYSAVVSGVDYASSLANQTINITDSMKVPQPGETAHKRTVRKRATKVPNADKKKTPRVSKKRHNSPVTYSQYVRPQLGDFMKSCNEGSFQSPYFPVYQEDCESSSSILNRQFDGFPVNSVAIMPQNWTKWDMNSNVYKIAGYNPEWDFCNNRIGYQCYGQSQHEGSSQMTVLNSNDWVGNSYMAKFMPNGELLSGWDFTDEKSNDSRLAGSPFPYYTEQGICYPEGLSAQDKQNVANPYFDISTGVSSMRMDHNQVHGQGCFISDQWQGDKQITDVGYVVPVMEVPKNEALSSNQTSLEGDILSDGKIPISSENADYTGQRLVPDCGMSENVLCLPCENDPEVYNRSPQQHMLGAWSNFRGATVGDQPVSCSNLSADIVRHKQHTVTRMYSSEHCDVGNSELGEITSRDGGTLTDCFVSELAHEGEHSQVHNESQLANVSIKNKLMAQGSHSLSLNGMIVPNKVVSGLVSLPKNSEHFVQVYLKDRFSSEQLDLGINGEHFKLGYGDAEDHMMRYYDVVQANHSRKSCGDVSESDLKVNCKNLEDASDNGDGVASAVDSVVT